MRCSTLTRCGRRGVAQEHSERVVNKNFRLLAGRPLYCWTLSALLGSGQISRIIIDTDSRKLDDEVASHFPRHMERITVRGAREAAWRHA